MSGRCPSSDMRGISYFISSNYMFNTPPGTRMSPGKKRTFNSLNLNKVRSRLDRIGAHKRELNRLRQQHNILSRKLAKSQAVYNQLIRRLISVYTGERLNLLENEPLTLREVNLFKKITRAMKTMSTALRTTRRFPFPENVGHHISRLASISSLQDPL